MFTPVVSPRKVLLIDDEHGQLQTLTDIFTVEGFQVCSCATYEEGLEHVLASSFGVAILDLRLYDRNGLELLRRIRETQSGTRVIIYTGFGSFASARDAVNLGAFAYVEKAGDPAELVAQVHRAVGDLLSESLTKSEQRYRDLLDQLSGIAWERELTGGRFTFVSRHAELLLGYPASQWLSEADFLANRIYPEDRDRHKAFLANCLGQIVDHELEYRIIAADGRVVWLRDIFRIVSQPGGSPSVLRGLMVDITEQKHAAQSLRDSEASLARAQQIARIGSWQLDLPTGRLIGSAELLQIAGLSAGEPIPDIDSSLARFVHPEDFDTVARAFAKVLELGFTETLEFRLLHQADFSIHHVRAEADVVAGPDGVPHQIIGTLQDITPQKQAEAALRESERLLHARITELEQVYRTAPIGLALMDSELRVLRVNEKFASFLGPVTEASPGRSLNDVWPDITHQVESVYTSVLTSGQPVLNVEVERPTPECPTEICSYLVDYYPLKNEDHLVIGVSTVVQDVTERKRTELELRRIQEEVAHISRLNTMTEMAAGVAHELNQPLSAIANYAAACSALLTTAEVSETNAAFEFLGSISEMAHESGQILRNLCGFTRRQSHPATPTDIRELIRTTLDMLQFDFRRFGISVKLHMPQHEVVATIDTVQIRQVIVNLIRNAIDAMISAEAENRVLSVTVGHDDSAIEVRVSDRGTGIPIEGIREVFDAFTTNKPHGTGIGLSISFRIISAHGGLLEAWNNDDAGATFRFTLPLQEWLPQ